MFMVIPFVVNGVLTKLYYSHPAVLILQTIYIHHLEYQVKQASINVLFSLESELPGGVELCYILYSIGLFLAHVILPFYPCKWLHPDLNSPRQSLCKRENTAC